MQKLFIFCLLGVLLAIPLALLAEEPAQINPNSLTGNRYKIVLNRLMPKILECYNKALQTNPALVGKLKVKVTVEASGETRSVEVVENNLGHAGAVECITKLLASKKWPTSSQPVFFEYTFTFAPAEQEQPAEE